jgi:hypothetical protein
MPFIMPLAPVSVTVPTYFAFPNEVAVGGPDALPAVSLKVPRLPAVNRAAMAAPVSTMRFTLSPEGEDGVMLRRERYGQMRLRGEHLVTPELTTCDGSGGEIARARSSAGRPGRRPVGRRRPPGCSASFCWQCGQPLLAQVRSDSVGAPPTH